MDLNRSCCRNYFLAKELFVLGLVVLVLSGCRGDHLPTVPVEGKVCCQGKPLEFGSVLFQPDRGPPARGLIARDGTFRLSTYGGDDGAVVGLHRVQITCFECQRLGAPFRPKPGEELNSGKLLIPPKYTRFETSGLRMEVKPSSNEPFLIDLQ